MRSSFDTRNWTSGCCGNADGGFGLEWPPVVCARLRSKESFDVGSFVGKCFPPRLDGGVDVFEPGGRGGGGLFTSLTVLVPDCAISSRDDMRRCLLGGLRFTSKGVGGLLNWCFATGVETVR